MTRPFRPPRQPFLLALAGSLLLHLALLLPAPTPAPPPPPPALQARLMKPPPPSAAPELHLNPTEPKPVAERTPPTAARPAEPPRETRPKAAARPVWTQTLRQHIERLKQQGQFYPAEAIAQGLQGDVLVRLMLDAEGKVIAARVEESCGHRILDDAALRAVRSVASLPADAPREVLLPVSFRLR